MSRQNTDLRSSKGSSALPFHPPSGSQPHQIQSPASITNIYSACFTPSHEIYGQYNLHAHIIKSKHPGVI